MRRIVPVTVLLAVFALLPISLSAQVAPRSSSKAVPKPPRDPDAVAAIQAAIAALGGEAVIGQIQSWQLQGQLQHTPKDGGNESGTFLWEGAGAEFRMQTAFPSESTVVVTGHGNPAIVSAGAPKAMPSHVIRSMFIPALVGSVLLKELQDANYSIESAGVTTLGSESVTEVRTASRATPVDAMVTPQTWYFDSASGLPVRLEYLLPAMVGPRMHVQSAADFYDYSNVAGVLYPSRIVRSHQNKQTDVFTLQSVNANAAVSPNDFDAPGGGVQ